MDNMKRVLAMILVFALVIGCFPMMNVPVVEAAGQTQKLVFDASADYSESNGNPNGQWSYKSYRTTPVFNSFGTSPTTDGAYTYWGNSSCYVDDDREGHDGYLMFRLANGTDYGAAVTFTAPYTGKISIRMKDDRITLGNANEPKGIHMWKNETTQMDLTGVLGTLSNSSYSFTEKSYEITQGETITFACINHGGTGTSLVYMNPIITYTEVDGQQTLFDATVDYSESNGNPNGQWSYKSYRTTPVFNSFGTSPTTDGAYTYWGNSSCYVDDDREGHDGYLMFRLANGTDYGAAVTFTAPYTGTISVRMKDDKISLGNANVPKGIHMWKNETTQMDLTDVLGTLSNSSYSFAETTYEVTKGETISFACINQGGTGTSLVYMDPIISYVSKSESQVELKKTFNAYDEFSRSENPNGPWRYASKTGDTYVDLVYNTAEELWGAAKSGYVNTTSSDGVTSQPSLRIRAEKVDTDIVVTFVAPYSGKIKVSMANGGVFAPYQNLDELSFTFKHNEQVISSVSDLDEDYNAVANRYFAGEEELTVERDDELHFIVHRNKQSKDPKICFNPQIHYEKIEDESDVELNEVNIELVTPTNNSEITIVSDSVKEWTENYDISETKFSEYLEHGDIYYSGQTTLKWKVNKKADSYTVKYGTKEDLSDANTITTYQSFARINNLYANTDYYWQVTANYADGVSTSDVFEFSTANTRRTVYIDGVSNTRDLGGIVNSDGVEIKQGMIYRGANLDNVTAPGINQAISELGIKTDLDLRTSGEGTAGTKSPLGDSINYINYNAPQYSLIAQYKTNVQKIIKVFAQEENYPIYYHCQVGRDRTGTIGVLLLGLLGVDKEEIYKDYELSAFSYMGGTIDHPDAAHLRNSLNELYEYLETYKNGDFSENVEEFLLDCGVTRKEIASIKRILLGEESGGSEVNYPTYDAYEEFTTESNPNGVWSYESYSVATNDSKLLEVKDTDKWVNQEGNIWVSKLTNGLQMLPMDAEGSAVSFKAPYSGAVELSMANGYIKSHSANHPATFYIIQGTRIIYKQDLGGTSDVQHEFERMSVLVEKDEMIHFVVARQKSGASGTSYISPVVTYTALGEDLLKFPANSEITVSKVKLDGFTVEWPEAVGGTGEYSYTVYCSEEPIYNIPKDGGIVVNGNRYSFENMTFNGQYYVAVVVDDGEHQLMMNVVEPIVVYPEMLRFNAYEDFTEKAQNSAWQYLKAPIGKSTMDALTWNETQWGDTAVGSVTTVEKNPVTGYPSLCVTPGTDTDVIVAFKAPYSGEIKVSMASAGIFTPLNGAGDQYDGINFLMKLNTTEKAKFEAVSAKHMHAVERDPNLYLGRLFTGSYEMSVTEGDVLYFVVNRNEALHNDQTYFNPVIEYTAVDKNTTNLKFGNGLTFTTSDVTKSTLTVHWPSAFGGTGEYNYTLYVSEKPMKSIPTSGGINMGDALSYSMKNLPDYTRYYFAVVADDGENQISMIHEDGFSTIGNTYIYDAAEDYVTEMQPISTPWRYYSQDVKTGKLTELTWNKTDSLFGTLSSSRVLKVSSDLVTGRPALRLNPSQGKDAVVAFTVPFSGTVTIDMSNGGVFAPYNGEAQKWDGVSFVLKQGTKDIFAKTTVSAKNNKENRCFTTGITVDVKKGEILYFIVNANANADMDSTFLSPRVKYTYVEKGSDDYGFTPGATIKATDVTKNGFTLNWSKVHNPNDTEVTYKVWIATSPIKQKPSSKAVYEGTGLKATCNGLKYATKYYAYIVATDSEGRSSILNSSDFVSTECPIYDAYKQYSDEKNEAGIWNYAIRTLDTEADEDTYVYTLLEYNEEGKRWGTSASGMVGTTESDLVTGRPAMAVHPGQKNQEAVVAFTAPYSGTVRITMNNGGVFTPHNGKDQNYDGIKFTIYHDGKEIYKLDKVSSENNPHAKRVGTDEIELTITYGQKLFFVVGPNAASAADSTYFNPQIEYLEVTGGSGVIDKLEGFLLPPVVVSGLDYPVNIRQNGIFDTDGIACEVKRTSLMPIVVAGASSFAGILLASLYAIYLSIKKMLFK